MSFLKGFAFLLLLVPLSGWGTTVEEFFGQRTSFEKIVRVGQGRVRGGVLEKETEVTQGNIRFVLPGQKEMTLYSTGVLKKATLGRDLDLPLVVGTVPVAAGTLLELKESGDLDLRKMIFVLRQ